MGEDCLMAKRILIADDEDNIRELVRASLEDEGYELFEARDGEEAVAVAKKIKPDLIVLDVMMPGKVGYQVCEEVKADPATRHAYVIFLSARGRPVAEMTGKLRGGDEYLTKPFDPLELVRRVNKALGK
jgi:two-component system, OmpR family, alkaline phosphatase synthesis response regulator PhoP